MYRVLAVAAVVVSAAGSSFTCRKGAYDGVELLSVDNVGSVEGCQDICKGIEGCASVTLAAGTCKVVGKTAVLDPTLEGTSCTLIETLDFDCADDRVFGTSVFSIGAVASLAECQQQCASFPAVCRGINYLPDGTCEIVEQTGVLADAGAKGQSCLRVGSVAANSAGADNQSAAGVLYTCIQRSAIDMATGEELLSFTAIESVEECFALCDELAVCRAFSLTGSDCVLVGKAAAGDLALLFEHKQNSAACMKADDGANTELAVLLASGAQTTAAATFECRTDLQLSGANMRIASGVSLSSCEKLCASLPECAAFTFEEQAKAAACFLKRDTVEPSLATAPSKGKACVKATYSGMFSKQPQGFATAVDSSAASAAAAGESAKDDESSAAGVRSLFACSPTGRASLTGGVRLSEVDNVATQEECFSLCLAKPACETVVFQPKRGVCALVAGEPTITRMPKGTQSSSETAICTKKQDLDFPRFRCEAGSFAGATLSSLAHIASPRECVEKCTAAPGCHVAVFHAADKRCVLKTVLATPVQATEGGVVSCVAVEVAQSKGFNCVGGAALTSGTISLLSDQSLSECRAMCGKMAECASLEYDTERRACALKDGDARVAAADAGHFVCAKTDGSSGDFHPRLVRALAASTQDYAVVKFKYGIHVDRLTAAVFSTLAAPDNTSTISTLWVRTQVRVPGGLAPKAYEATVLREIDDEMAHHHGAFLSNLNPSLATLGLATLCAGSVECRWSVVSEGVEWKTSDAPAVVLELEAPAGTRDFTSDAERIVLANSMGHLLDVAAHQVSITSIQHCVADACQLAWEAATPDGTGGATAAAAGFGESTVQKVSVVVTLASGASTAEFCGKAAASPVCSDATTPVPFPSFSCVSCEATAGDASSGAGSASLGRRVLAQSRQANTLALTGLSRSCEVGWMPADFGIASHVFDAADGNLEGKTLQQCVDACAAAPGCVAFSRIFALAADEAGACLLKTAAPSVAGDVTARLGYRTYVVSCPLVEHACAFTPAPGADARAANSSFDTARTASFKECKALCEADASCHAVSYDTVKALCHLIPADSPVDLQVHTDYTSAVCVREGTHTASPCDDGYCGITAAHSCFEYGSSGGFQCGCSPGFSCAERCDDPRQAHGCERTAAMLGLYVDAVATSLSVGVGAVEVAVEEVEKVDDDVPGVRPGVTEAPADPVVVVSRSKIDANATHVAAVTFESTNTEELFGLSGPSTKLQLFLEAVANDLGLPPAAVTAKTLCQHAPDGSVVACVDADGAATELHLEPLIRVTPVRNHQNGVDWCASVDPVVLATTKTQDDIDSLVQAAGGLLMDTRRYWVSAVCDDGCDAGANWGWADGAAVDWAAIGLSELAADAKCAVLEWSAEEFRWGLAAVACDRADAYPVCVYLSAPDAEALCAATSDCALKVTVAVVLPHVHTVSFVTLPGGATKMYHPTVALPPNAKMVAQDGSSLGYTDANGRTTAIRYPAVDQTTNAVVLSVLPGYTYISEALSALLRMHIAAWLSQASVTTKLSELCHQSVSMQQIKCTDGLCSASNPPLITRTSCEGSPPCSNNDCNGNGYVRGFAGHCQCTCLQGFTGTDCGSCATGYVHYPTCEWNEANGAEPQYIFAHLLLSTSPSSVGAQLSLLGDNLDTAIGYMSDQTFIAYVCPTSVCATKSCDSAIMSWDPSRRAMCDTTDDNATDVSTARSVALLEADETLVEVQVQFNAFFSRKAAAAAQEFQQTMQDYLNQESGTFGNFGLQSVKIVYGPSSIAAAVTPVEGETPEADVEPIPVVDKSAGGADGFSSGTDWGVILVVAIAAVIFCCCIGVFGCWRYRKNQLKKQKTKDLLGKVAEEEPAEDIVTIFKDVEEPMGIMWDDHTLMVGICENSAAARAGCDRFRNRRIAKVNGKEVKTLSDIRYAVEGQSVVTLEFEPRYSAIVVRVHSSIEDFTEHPFLQAFADRIARALNLMDFTEMDMDLQSIVERTEKGELLLTIKLLGLTSDQVATIVALCVTPGEHIRAGLPIVGAYLATNKGDEMPRPVWVCCQWLSEAAHASGCYLQLQGVQEGGMPVYQHIPADHWMYSTPSGHWAIVDDQALIGQEVTSQGYVMRSTEPHRGAEPFVITSWRTPLREDCDVQVSEDEPRVGEFIVGQKVIFPQDVELGDGAYINKKAEAIVMGETDDGLVKVCLLNEEFDVVTIDPDVLDSPDGPRVMLLEGERWMHGNVVKQRGDMLKIHLDCGLCQDVWVDRVQDASKLKISPVKVFAIGEKVQLSEDVSETVLEEGCITHGDIGQIVACGDLGQARPYLVEGPYELAWYAGTSLVSFHGDDNTPFGNDSEAKA